MRVEPRVAFFTDSYLEVNGVARTSRQLAAFAQRRELPFLCVHAGPETQVIEEGSLTRLALNRTSFGFRLDSDLRFDLLMWRHKRLAVETVRRFKAEAVHITGPSDIGQLGAYVAWKLRLPLVISWHTNVHEYAGRRLGKALRWLPAVAHAPISDFAEGRSLQVMLQFYKLGHVLLAPNEELRDLLETRCKRPTMMMRRGVETDLFSPARRERRDSVFTIGYVGRLTPEKNVRFLADLERGLLRSGVKDFRFSIVGAGSEREWLEKNLQCATFEGVLRGEALARAYANLDLFVFPSQTDTFGNVILEAQAAGAPAIVSARGGPKFIIRDAVTGIVARDERQFVDSTLELMTQPARLQGMREAARELACQSSWDKVFEQVYQAYELSLQPAPVRQMIPLQINQSIVRGVSGDATS